MYSIVSVTIFKYTIIKRKIELKTSIENTENRIKMEVIWRVQIFLAISMGTAAIILTIFQVSNVKHVQIECSLNMSIFSFIYKILYRWFD